MTSGNHVTVQHLHLAAVMSLSLCSTLRVLTVSRKDLSSRHELESRARDLIASIVICVKCPGKQWTEANRISYILGKKYLSPACLAYVNKNRQGSESREK